MARGSKRVGDFIRERDLEARVVTLDDSTKTSKMAADALGCTVAEIAKSIVFVNEGPVVVVISGDRRVDAEKLSGVMGHRVSVADADAVRRGTGYVIGGVPPFPHEEGVTVLLDASLERFERVWAAAGTPNSVMQLSVGQLKSVLGGRTVDVSK